MTLTYRWLKQEIDDSTQITKVQDVLNELPHALARGLVVRGITTLEEARKFFRPDRANTHDPFLMEDMDLAAERLAAAIENGDRVLVYGDYDVDGATSAAMMTHFLRNQGVEAEHFIPDRHKHGYGLSEAGIDEASEMSASLIVALDCGITAIDEAAYARDKGIDMIICDHHTAGDVLPDATAVLNPKRPDCAYPFKELSGCGVGFKLIAATLDQLGQDPDKAYQYADLLAISIASDIVPVNGENRILLREGVDLLRQEPRLGLRMMARQAEIDLPTLTSGRIVFGIGPRINAAGRLDHAGHAVDLLLADEENRATHLAKMLEEFNTKRRDIDQETAQAAYKRAERYLTARKRHALVLHEPDWHQGVIGIVASRVVERYYRPTVMLTTAGSVLKGSARSITGINIYDALSECEDLLEQFGGHTYAAGLTLDPAHLDRFRKRLDEVIGEMVTPELLMPAIKVDATIDLEEIGSVKDRFWAVLKQFGPFGPQNSRPIFQTNQLEVLGKPKRVGKSEKHLAFSVRPAGSENGRVRHRVIGFGLGERIAMLRKSQREGKPFDLLYSIEENTWRGNTSLQLRARDLRLSDS